MLYCTALNYTVLYCTELYCTVLRWTVLYCTALYCTVLYYTALNYTVLPYTIPHCAILNFTALNCTALCHTAVRCAETDLESFLHPIPESIALEDLPIKMEVGIEDCLHIEFEYNKSKYHLKVTPLFEISLLTPSAERSLS